MSDQETVRVCEHGNRAGSCTACSETEAHQIPIWEINLSSGYDTMNKIEMFIDFLRKNGIEPEKYFYSGVNGNNIQKVLATGNYHDEEAIYCASFSDLTDGTVEHNPLSVYAVTFNKPAMVLYNPNYLEENGVNYSFKNGIDPKKAVVAIIKVKGLKK
jgi:hypothetical protein